MNIDKIELNSFTCQSLFSNKLVDSKLSGEINTKLENSAIDFLGDNRKKVVFVVNNDKEKYVSNEEMALLNNLLAACKLSLGDISLVNFYPARNIDYEIINERFNAKYILLFGITCAQIGLPFNIPHFQVQKFQDQTYLFNPPFNDLLTDKNSKSALWICLKKMFLQ
jgi:hypothetical protein